MKVENKLSNLDGERVFTQNEVRAMVDRILESDALSDSQKDYIIHVAWDHGVSFKL